MGFGVSLSFSEQVGTAEKLLKSSSLNGALWRNLERCFGIWNYWETFDI